MGILADCASGYIRQAENIFGKMTWDYKLQELALAMAAIKT